MLGAVSGAAGAWRLLLGPRQPVGSGSDGRVGKSTRISSLRVQEEGPMPAQLRLHPIMSLDGPGGPAEDAWSPLEEPAYEDRAPRGPHCEGAPGRAISLRRPLPSVSLAGSRSSEEAAARERRQEGWRLRGRDDGGGVRAGFLRLRLAVLAVQAGGEGGDDPGRTVCKAHLLLRQ